ncbi:hypothetical protein IFR05_012499 [Cadophora sp. M221]|nr:hypothetical protein IFR05_012499 [Cadophora sp. M221]
MTLPESPLSNIAKPSGSKKSNDPSRWDENNRPSRSDLFEVIRAVCHLPVVGAKGTSSHQGGRSESAPVIVGLEDLRVEDTDAGAVTRLPKPASSTIAVLKTPNDKANSHLPPWTNLTKSPIQTQPVAARAPAYIQPIASVLHSACRPLIPPPRRPLCESSLRRLFANLISLMLQLASIGDSVYSLSIQPVNPRSLNNTPVEDYYHHLLRTTTFFITSSSTIKLIRTVCFGRIYSNGKPTYWVVVMDVECSDLFALRSDYIAYDEQAEVENPVDDLGMLEVEDPVPLPAFDDGTWLAVFLGDVTVLDEESDTEKVNYRALYAER